MEELSNVVQQGWEIKLYKFNKRVGDLNNRRFENRYCWKASLDEYLLESEWYGFGTNELAVIDMVEKIKNL
ncbi:MAG: hypothetical protein ACJA1B_001407 [Polaribacter sp.]|jgi:hypothetical protein